SLDLSYHDLNPDRGLYYHLRQRGEVARIVSDEFIAYATEHPPSDTRAHARGMIVRALKNNGSGSRHVVPGIWGKIIIAPGTQAPDRSGSPSKINCVEESVPDPRRSYADLIDKLLARADR
ncbi:MAG: proteasome accessory factor A, partial [Parcubacteria group bacterium Gr01-1014_72]